MKHQLLCFLDFEIKVGFPVLWELIYLRNHITAVNISGNMKTIASIFKHFVKTTLCYYLILVSNYFEATLTCNRENGLFVINHKQLWPW